MPRQPFDLIAFDGDDTLWHNERSYRDGRGAVSPRPGRCGRGADRGRDRRARQSDGGAESRLLRLRDLELHPLAHRNRDRADRRARVGPAARRAHGAGAPDDHRGHRALSRSGRGARVARRLLSVDAHHQGRSAASTLEARSIRVAGPLPLRRGGQSQDTRGLLRHPVALRRRAGALPDGRQFAAVRYPAGRRRRRLGGPRACGAHLVARTCRSERAGAPAIFRAAEPRRAAGVRRRLWHERGRPAAEARREARASSPPKAPSPRLVVGLRTASARRPALGAAERKKR